MSSTSFSVRSRSFYALLNRIFLLLLLSTSVLHSALVFGADPNIVVTVPRLNIEFDNTTAEVLSAQIINRSGVSKSVSLRHLMVLARTLAALAARKLAQQVLKKPVSKRYTRHVTQKLKERGWTDKEIENLLKNPDAISRSSGQNGPQTVYWKNNREYIVVDNKNNVVTQIFDKNATHWTPHHSIEYPYPGTWANPLPFFPSGAPLEVLLGPGYGGNRIYSAGAPRSVAPRERY